MSREDKEKLEKLWKTLETKQLAKIFEDYMKSMGVKKYDNRKHDNNNTYLVDGKSTVWNKVHCYYMPNSSKYGEENLSLVLRKRAGDYFIVQIKSDRAFEIDYSGIRHYEKDLLTSIIEEHRPLFDTLFSLCRKEQAND